MEKENKPLLIVVAGPTAVGKSDAAVALAKQIGGEVVSADSMQVYRGMDIGSAKVTKEEMEGVPHHLIDCVDPGEDYNVTRFREMAKAAVEEIIGRGHIPIICGGTGFYIQALIYDIHFSEEEVSEEYRSELLRLAEERGPEYLHGMLKEVDPPSAEAIHANNIKRVIRALEYHHLTGERISDHNRQQRERTSPFDVRFFVLTDDRQVLYDRIDERVDRMMEAGLLEEVRGLYEAGLRPGTTAAEGIGYKQLLPYFAGETSLEEATERIKTESRHYAKRQLTWFKRERDVIWLDRRDFTDTAAIVEEMKRYV